MYSPKEAIEVIKQSNAKQLAYLDQTKGETEYTVSRKTMMDNAIAIDWLIKYIESGGELI